MSDDLAGRLGDYATHLEDVGALPAAALVREAATRLSPPESAGRDRVEAVARARDTAEFAKGVAWAADTPIERAFELGFCWQSALRGQTLEDSRAVSRTLGSDIFAGLPIDQWAVPGFESADIGICAAKAEIKRALVAALAALPSEAEGAYVMDTVRRWDEAASTFVVVDELVRRPTSEAEGAEMMREDGPSELEAAIEIVAARCDSIAAEHAQGPCPYELGRVVQDAWMRRECTRNFYATLARNARAIPLPTPPRAE